MRAVLLGMLALLACARGASAAAGGPDGFGYTYVDSNEPGGPVFHLIDITATGTPVLVGTDEDGGDDIAGIVDLTAGGAPGLGFYGVTYPQLVMASNGFLTTDLDDVGNDISNDCPLPQNPSVPVGTNGARLYPLHDDLVLTPGIGAGYHQYFPSAGVAGRPPDRGADVGVHVFLWKAATHFRPPPNPDPPRFDFEALLYDNGDVVFLYGAGDPDAGATSTTGIQNPAPPTAGLAYACNTPGSLSAGLAVLFRNPLLADVALLKMVDDPTPIAGDTITYTVVARNVGQVDAFGVQVTDVLPPGLTLVSAVPSGGTFAAGVWSVPPLAPGAAAALSLVVRVGPDRGGQTIAAAAARTAIAAPLFDADRRNDVATATISVAFRPPLVGFGQDTDGDRFSDHFEAVAGSNAGDLNDTPFGVAASPAPLEVETLGIRLDFSRDGRDDIRVAGRLPLADPALLDGASLVLDVGGIAKAFTLERRGRGARGRLVAEHASLRIGRPRAQRAKFTARFRMGTFGQTLALTGGLADADVRAQARIVRVTILFPPSVLTKAQAQIYTARKGKAGRTRSASTTSRGARR
jgi:uncharacterized repeat protein (TIGR01451 family)